MKIPGLGLRGKILAISLLTVVFCFITFTAVDTRYIRNALIEEFESKGVALVKGLASNVQDTLLNRDASTIQGFIDQYRQIKGVDYVFVINDRGNVVAHTFSPVVPPEYLKLVKKEVGNTKVEVRKIEIGGKHILDIQSPILAGLLGRAYIGMDLDEVEDKVVNPLIKESLVMAVVITLTGIFLIVAVLNRVLRPVEQLTKAAKSISSEKRFDQKLEKFPRDEIGELSGAFNLMIEELKKHTDSLEDRVEERTQELEKSRKKLERNNLLLSQLNEKIQDDEVRMRSIMNNVADGIITINWNGNIETFNASAERIFGYAGREVIGKNVEMLMPESYRVSHREAMDRYRKTKKARILGGSVEVEGLRKDGTVFPLDLAISEVNIRDKRIFSGILRDITERRKEANELRRAKEEAEKANHAKSEFLSRMSHELRTPMNAILGFGQLLEFDVQEPLTPGQKEKVDEILKGGNHLLELINEILDLSRIEAGKLTFSIETVELLDLAEDTLVLVNPLAQQRGITIENRLGEEPVFVLADRTKLKQILLNLLSNAVKYNREQGSVWIEAEQREDRVRVTVGDTGPGIPREKQSGIFEPFDRLGAENTEVEGTGIGLTITKRLVEKMNGTITLESEPGKGSRFTLDLPAGKEHPDFVEPDVEERGAEPSVAGLQRTILYVEDNPANLILVQQILKQESNIRLLSAPQAQIGIDLARAHRPDLILMDINMPEMDGITALKKLRTFEETRAIPVIAVSANAMESDIKKAMAAGFHSYITKPFNVVTFLDEVNGCLKSMSVTKA